jgi:4-diphosphocytidyl-2-C-methyl-D-erythritol kinase
VTSYSAGVSVMDELNRVARTRAPAKLNLTLLVGSRRDDGFHELATIFQAISIFDEIEVKFRRCVNGDKLAKPMIYMSLDGPDLGPDDENLAWRAAAAFMEQTGKVGDVEINLKKLIPAGAGLGGGSSDAAAVIRCLAKITAFTDKNMLNDIARGIGSDVAFFLGDSTTAIGTGRGDCIEQIDPLPQRPIAVAIPPVHVSTKDAYRALAGSRDQSRSFALPAIGTDVTWEGLLDGEGINDFQTIVSALHESVEDSLSGLAEAGARVTMLSGSGSAAFALFDDAVGFPEIDMICSELTDLLGWPVLSGLTLVKMPGVELA